MKLPEWVRKEIDGFAPPLTGKVVISLELYQGGVTKVEIGGSVRFRPPEPSK